MQAAFELVQLDTGASSTAVAVGIAKLGEPAVVANYKDRSGFLASGRGLSVAAGRISYTYGLKVIPLFFPGAFVLQPGMCHAGIAEVECNGTQSLGQKWGDTAGGSGLSAAACRIMA